MNLPVAAAQSSNDSFGQLTRKRRSVTVIFYNLSSTITEQGFLLFYHAFHQTSKIHLFDV